MPIISRKDSPPGMNFDLMAGISVQGRIFQDYAKNENFVNYCFGVGLGWLCGKKNDCRKALPELS
jgi:hypothetical protein